MKILHLISSSGHYGAESMLITLAKSLDSLGCDNVVGVFDNLHRPGNGTREFVKAQGLSVHVIPCKRRADWDAVREIRGFVRTRQIDVVHTHGYKADLYGYLATRGLQTALVASCHNWTNQTVALRLYALLDNIVLKRFRKIVAVSEGVAGSLRRFGIPRDKITTIDNGIDLCAFKTARPTLAEEIRNGARTVVGMVGRLVLEKGPQHFLLAAREILADFPNTLFVLVGDGPLRNQLEELARELKILPHVAFLGERRDMPGLYASMDVFVLPSINEGMPMTILEALAAGKAVVATRVGAVPKLIIPERTGLLVEPRDTAALRNAIVRLLADTKLRSELGQHGQAWAVRNFSAEGMARKYLDLYEALVDKRAEPVAVGKTEERKSR